jgi:hypothetical protein
VRLVEAPGHLRGRELDVLGWQMTGRETALVCSRTSVSPLLTTLCPEPSSSL